MAERPNLIFLHLVTVRLGRQELLGDHRCDNFGLRHRFNGCRTYLDRDRRGEKHCWHRARQLTSLFVSQGHRLQLQIAVPFWQSLRWERMLSPQAAHCLRSEDLEVQLSAESRNGGTASLFALVYLKDSCRRACLWSLEAISSTRSVRSSSKRGLLRKGANEGALTS
jgi:hypothetical protein